jgi:hypothetical protein
MKSTVGLAILAISLIASTGCTTMSDVGANMRRSARMFRPRPFDETLDEEAEDTMEDDWGKMMSEGRPRDQSEAESDSWWWNKVMSPQSRSIERSLGVGP